MAYNKLTFEELKEISKRIKELISQRKYEEALELCTDEICEQDVIILSQKITILIKMDRCEEALELCTVEGCEQSDVIQDQKITILFILERYEEIVEECDKGYNRWKNKRFVQSKLIAISHIIKKLIRGERYEEALELCTDENCKQNEAIQGQKNYIEYLIKKISLVDENEKITYTEKFKNEVNEIICKTGENEINLNLTRIYFGDITIEEIYDLQVDSWMKLILQIAYFEKYNKSLGIKLIKKGILEEKRTDKEKKYLNKLKERMLNKKNVLFDLGLYCEILNCSINYNYEKRLNDQEMNPDRNNLTVKPFCCREKKTFKKDVSSKDIKTNFPEYADANILVKEQVTKQRIKEFIKNEKYPEAIKECNRLLNKKECLMQLKSIAMQIKERLRNQEIVVDDNKRVLKLCEKIISFEIS